MSDNVWPDKGAQFGREAYNAGIRAVLRCVYANLELRPAGVGADLTTDEQEAVRYLRQKVWGKNAVDFKPRRERPAMGRKLHQITKRVARKRGKDA